MKGVIFNILEEFVEHSLGKEGLEKLRQAANLKPFMAIGNYPDELVGHIVTTASGLTNIPVEDLVFSFGRFFPNSPTLHKVYGQYFKMHNTAKAMLLYTDDLHTRLTKSIPGATPPAFRYEEPAPNQLIMHYASHRGLCTLLRGAIHGVGDVYNEQVDVKETACMKKGAKNCSLHVTFLGAKTLTGATSGMSANR